jgi:hypothetical protein
MLVEAPFGAVLRTIDKYQTVRVEVRLGLEPSPALLQDVRPVLLRSVGGLFLRVIRRRSKNRHSVPMPADTPALASSARISRSVMSDF